MVLRHTLANVRALRVLHTTAADWGLHAGLPPPAPSWRRAV